jgi:phage protein U
MMINYYYYFFMSKRNFIKSTLQSVIKYTWSIQERQLRRRGKQYKKIIIIIII